MVSVDLPQETPKGRQAPPYKNSTSSSEKSSSPDDGGGVRISDLNLTGSPLGYRMGRAVNNDTKVMTNSTQDTTPVTFKIAKPTDDIFATPNKDKKPRRAIPGTVLTNMVAGRRFGSGRIVPAQNLGAELELAQSARNLRHQSSDISGINPAIQELDAQGIYPQSSCVFVANLPENKDDRTLEIALTREFSKYGTVFVKIRRDGHNMPFAFCQYTHDEDAKQAMEMGRGAVVLGRACRTEMVKANRTFMIQKKDGSKITVGEAYTLMKPFGALDKCETTPYKLGEAPSVTVHFKMYDASRDLVAAFRNNDEYRVVAAFDPAGKAKIRAKNSNESFMVKYDTERRSIFVDGLQEDMSKEEVVALFEQAGEVVEAQIVKKTHPTGIRTYAFIQFKQYHIPEIAIKQFHDTVFQGGKLRVERKLGRQPFRIPRRVQSQMLATGTIESPTPQVAGPRRPVVARRNASITPSRGPSAVQHSGGAIVSGGQMPTSVATPTAAVPAVVGAVGTPTNDAVPFVGHTPVQAQHAFGFPTMGYAGHLYSPGAYYPPQVAASPTYMYNPGWPYYNPYNSPTTLGFPATIMEGNAEHNGQGEEAARGPAGM